MRHLSILFAILLTAGLTFESFAVDTFDASAVDSFAMSEMQEESGEDAEVASAIQERQIDPLGFFVHSLKDMAASTLANDLGFQPGHGQPLPGVLITILLGGLFGLARRKRGAHIQQVEDNATDALLITARLFRLNTLFLNPPETIHTISPGPDLFCLRE